MKPTSGRSSPASGPRSRSTPIPTGRSPARCSRSSPRRRPSRTSPCSRCWCGSTTRKGCSGPGMNAEVEIHVGRRDSVLAVPNAALRTQRDVGSAAQVLGLSPDDASSSSWRPPADLGHSAGATPRPGIRPPGETRPAARRWARRTGRQPESARAGRRPGRPEARRAGDRAPIHRVRQAQRPADPGLDPHRPDRSGLQRGAGGPDRLRLGAGAAEREPGAVAAGHAGADQSDDRWRRGPRHAATDRASRRAARGR